MRSGHPDAFPSNMQVIVQDATLSYVGKKDVLWVAPRILIDAKGKTCFQNPLRNRKYTNIRRNTTSSRESPHGKRILSQKSRAALVPSPTRRVQSTRSLASSDKSWGMGWSVNDREHDDDLHAARYCRCRIVQSFSQCGGALTQMSATENRTF